MNFSQLHDRVREELLRRIERGTLSVSLLARQTGLGQPHLSNFLRKRRQLSLDALDKVLRAQSLTVADLLPAERGELTRQQMAEVGQVPLVSHATALAEPYLRLTGIQRMVPLPAEATRDLRPRCPSTRRQWERFVAIRLAPEDSRGMEPMLLPGAVVVLDRHYTSFRAYREGIANLYAVAIGAKLLIRQAEFFPGRVVARPLQLDAPFEVIAVDGPERANDYLVGRVVLILNQC
jgi:transcriptional regulator with XRE-family HTH domain